MLEHIIFDEALMSESLHKLFEQYVDICNRAMQAHKDEFPYKHIWEAAENVQSRSGVHLAIYDDEPQAKYRVRIKDKHISLAEDAQPDPDEACSLKASFLRKVVENPEEYINHPAKLDWHWLKD